jgi:hypothetical protein
MPILASQNGVDSTIALELTVGGSISPGDAVMRRKSAFNQGHFWENLGMFVFMAAGLAGLWYMMTNVISW